MAKFSSYYATHDLAAKLGISDGELLEIIDSPSVKIELEGKSFTIGWKEGLIALTWLEEGISESKTDINKHYFEEGGKFYSEFRITEKVVYLDGTERIVSDTGAPKRVCITKDAYMAAIEQIRRKSGKQE